MKIKNSIAIFLLLLAFGSCVDPLDVNIDRDEFILVVEGSVTTEAKEHMVRLTRSAKYGTIFEGVIRGILNASVILRDQDGNVTEFVEKTPSRYYSPPGFQAVVGNTYTLEIITRDGETYMSFPETVNEVPEIEEIVPVFRELPAVGDEEKRTGLEIYSRFIDPADEKNYYLWELGGTYFLKTYPENFVFRPPFGPPTPAPKDCCAECWITEKDIDRSIKVANDFLTNGSTTTELAGFLEDDGKRFNEKYLLRIRQISQSKEAHQFFRLLNDQINIDGDIFDAPPGQIRGNFYNVNDLNQPVLGYFWMGDAKIDSVFIDRGELAQTQALVRIDDDCRLQNGATVERPSYW